MQIKRQKYTFLSLKLTVPRLSAYQRGKGSVSQGPLYFRYFFFLICSAIANLKKNSNTGSFVINISCWNSGIVIYKNTHNFFVKMQKIWILFNHFDFYFLKSYFYWKLTRLSNVTVIFVDEIFQFVQYLYRKVHTNNNKMQIPHLTKIQFDQMWY